MARGGRRGGLSLRLPVVLVAFATAGCARGCARDGLRRVEEAQAAPSAVAAAVAAMDCAPDLLRCEDGERFRSRGGRVPPGAACPEESLGLCPGGCVAEGVVLVPGEAPIAEDQLCAPATRRVRPAPVGAASPCEEGESYRCEAGVVRRCGGGVVAACAVACALPALGDDGATLEAKLAATLLCR